MQEPSPKTRRRSFSLRFLLGIAAVIALLIVVAQYVHWRMNTIPISVAVSEFNTRSRNNSVGQSEPLITTEEVLSAIERALSDGKVDAKNRMVLDDALRSHRVPTNAWLRARDSMSVGSPPKNYPIWWVDLHLAGGPTSSSAVAVRATDRPAVATSDPPWIKKPSQSGG